MRISATSTLTLLLRGIALLSPILICWVDAVEPSENEKSKCTDKERHYPCMLWKEDWSLWCNQSIYDEIPDPKSAVSYASCENITALYIDDSCLKELKRKSLRKYPDLQTFLGGKNFIRELPAKVFSKNTKLEKIDLCGNRIESIDPTAFLGLSNLKELNLEGNNLTRVPGSTFRDLSSLTRLSFSDNKVAVLHSGVFRGLKNLRTLELTENRIGYIDPRAFSGLSRLENLHLDKNRLTSIDAKIFPKTLKVLTLSYNEIREWIPLDGVSLQNVHTLDLSFNRMSKFELPSLRNMRELQNLILKNNSLSLLPEDLFSLTPKLRELDVADNLLEEIGINIFAHLCHLEILVLRSNKLKTPRPEWFTRIVQNGLTKSSDLSGNDWHCDCDALPFEKFLRDLRSQEFAHPIWSSWTNALQITCRAPIQLDGYILDESIAQSINDGDRSPENGRSKQIPCSPDASYNPVHVQCDGYNSSITTVHAFLTTTIGTKNVNTRENITNNTLVPNDVEFSSNYDSLSVWVSLSAVIMIAALILLISYRFCSSKRQRSPAKHAENMTSLTITSDRRSASHLNLGHLGLDESQQNFVSSNNKDESTPDNLLSKRCYFNEAMVTV